MNASKIIHARARAFALAALAFLGALRGTARAGDAQIDLLPTGASTVAISAPGSYLLVANVTMTADIPCIQITAGHVTVDLNGHTLAGTGSGGPGASGIIFSNASGVTIRNGTIRNFGGEGIAGGPTSEGATLEDLRLEGNILNGANLAADDARIDRVQAFQNGMNGISAASNAQIARCLCVFNGLNGVLAADNATVEDATAFGNGSSDSAVGPVAGIQMGDYGQALRCVAGATSSSAAGSITAAGIYAHNNCLMEGNTCGGNESPNSDGVGILGFSNCVILNNTCASNFGGPSGNGRGISTAGNSRIEGNACWKNGGPNCQGVYAISTGVNSIVARNVCTENTNNGISAVGSNGYFIVAGGGCTIRENIVANNTARGNGWGILIGPNSVIESNSVTQNNSITGFMSGIESSNAVIAHNVSSNNTVSPGPGAAYGIYAQGGCRVFGNVCGANNGASVSPSGSYGIYCSGENEIIDNIARFHSALGGNIAAGISASSESLVRGNTCTHSSAGGSGGRSYGILADSDCRIEANHCQSNQGLSGSTQSFGIAISGSGNFIAKNTTGKNTGGGSAAGISFLSGTANNRAQENVTSAETTAILNSGGATNVYAIAGDLANQTL